MFLKHGQKNDKITLQTVVTLGIASQSWSRTKSGGQTYTFQFTGTNRHAFSFKGIGRGTDNVEFLTNWRPTGGAYRFPVNLFWQILWFVLSTARCCRRVHSVHPSTYSVWVPCGVFLHLCYCFHWISQECCKRNQLDYGAQNFWQKSPTLQYFLNCFKMKNRN